MKKIDIIIPAYNPGPYLRDALNSVFCQTYKNFEVFVIDDCSTQNIDSIVRSYPNVNLLKTDKNSGPSAARNLGIKMGNSEFISFLDSDDIMDNKKLERTMAAFEREPYIGMVCGNYRVIYNRRNIKKPFYSNPIDITYNRMLRQNFVASGSTTLKRSVLDDVGLFDESLWISEDYDLWLRVSEKYKIKYLHEVLYYYSIIPNNGSLTNSDNSKSLGKKNNELIRARSISRMKNAKYKK